MGPQRAPEREQRAQVAGARLEIARRLDAEEIAHRERQVVHVQAEALVALGVDRGMALELEPRVGGVVPAHQVVAVGRRRERAVERQQLETVPRKIEVADDARAQQADDVRADAEAEPGIDLLGHRRAADALATLEDENVEAGAGEVGGAHQAVVPAAHDDRVPGFTHRDTPLRGRGV